MKMKTAYLEAEIAETKRKPMTAICQGVTL